MNSDNKLDKLAISKIGLDKEQLESSLREYICIKCGAIMPKYSFGLGAACRCISCGYKDGCCE